MRVTYRATGCGAERILLDAAETPTVKIADPGEEDLREMERRYVMRRAEMVPRVFWRITDNWLELTVRFLAYDHDVRELKDAMARHVLNGSHRISQLQ